jgi:hypothetical protein
MYGGVAWPRICFPTSRDLSSGVETVLCDSGHMLVEMCLVKLGRFCLVLTIPIVTCTTVHVVTSKELGHLVVPTLQQCHHMSMTPVVQIKTPYPRGRHSIRSMSSTAIQTQQDTVGNTGPFGRGRSTIHTVSVARNLEEQPFTMSWKGMSVWLLLLVVVLLLGVVGVRSEMFQLAGGSLDECWILLLTATHTVLKTNGNQSDDDARQSRIMVVGGRRRKFERQDQNFV